MTLLGVLAGARRGLQDLVLEKGFKVFATMLEDARTSLCGPPHRPQPGRQAYRYGHSESRVVFGGRKILVAKPRARSLEGYEVELPNWRELTDEDPLRSEILKQILVGVSTRQYRSSLEPLALPSEPQSVSRSSVSRRFVAQTSEQVNEFLARPLGDLDLPVLMFDGKTFGDHVILVALGIDAQGNKHALGATEGSSESEEVSRSLLGQLVERGMPVERARLVVIDGGKGLRKAVRSVLGQWALVQRCPIDKLRNVVDHLPESKRIWASAVIRKAYAKDSVPADRRNLLGLASQLEKQHPGAAGSLREGLDETLTVIDLGLAGWLRKTLRSTNPIELSWWAPRCGAHHVG